MVEPEIPVDGAERLVGAFRSTAVPIVMSDPRLPDNPLIWVNPAFSEITGYGFDEAVGRNCRFLQGPETDPGTVRELRETLADGRNASVTLLNYRRDGTPFWNQVCISPVFDDDGSLVSFVGIQLDVSRQMRAEATRADAHAAENVARRDAELARADTDRARRRIDLLADATTQLAATLDVDETLERLARLLVPVLADWVSVILVDDHGEPERIATRHRDGLTDLLSRYRELAIVDVRPQARSRQVIESGTAVLVANAADLDWRSLVTSTELVDIVEQLGMGSLLYVPLVARNRRVIGSMSLIAGPSGRVFTKDDLAVAEDIGRRASITLDNARLYEREHAVAETLQRSLLPDLPAVDGLVVAARYKPGDAAAEVGGDFYDLLRLPDGSVGVAVGDVVGHDLAAAAAMGHLRGILRAAAWDEADSGGDPARVVDRVNRVMQGLDLPLATLLYGVLRRGSPGCWELDYANGGHPPALLLTADGTVRRLDDSQGTLLGVTDVAHPRAATVAIPAGSTLVAFTDGLVERRHETIDVGYARIVDALRAHVGTPEALVDRLIRLAGSEEEDDTAIIVIQNPAG